MKKFLATMSAAAVLATSALLGATSEPAGAYPTADVALVGHGWGHGRGMSQFGSLGQALAGRGWETILDHYYSNTTMGTVSNMTIGVRLTANDGKDLIVRAGAPYKVAGIDYSANNGALVRRVGANSFAVFRSGGCGGEGGWQQLGTFGGPIRVDPPTYNPGNDQNLMVTRCTAEGSRTFRGNIDAIDDNGVQRAVNSLPIEEYLKGVVPRESPASWADLGGGSGINALRAQSVAARSYVLASANYSYATTCDTTACQVYGGAFLNGVRIEDDRTNRAIADTAGKVRRLSGGAVARTEFSSSSGGYTAGGTFPAVSDPWDEAQGRNPNFKWSATVPVTTVQNAYPSIGGLNSVMVNSRNGLGDQGGRVLSVTLSGTNGSVTITGAQFRSKFGLKSDWFQVTGMPSGGVNGYWLVGPDGAIYSFGGAPFHGSAGNLRLARPIVGMAPAHGNGGYWLVASDGGVFSYGTARFFGSTGNIRLNRPVVGMTPTNDNNGYWMVASDGGIFAYGNARFFGSTGNIRLNQPVNTMAATATGNGYWLVAADGGVFAYGDAQFHGSTGNLKLAQPIVSMARTPDGNGYWLLGADGGIFAFGNARYFGSLPDSRVVKSAASIAPTKTGSGYMITATDGSVYSFGDAPNFGGVPNAVPGFKGSVVGIAPVG